MEEEVTTFLYERGVSQDAVERMKEHKFDRYVIEAADDETLSNYLPLQGDRVAVKRFCKTINQTKEVSKDKKKNSILQSLRNKLQLKRRTGGAEKFSDSEESDSVLPSKKQSTHTHERNTRKIEIGWLMFDDVSQTYKQVRKKQGGGTRKVDINKTADISDIMSLGKKLFFPGGHSSSGKESDFIFEIRDFSLEEYCSKETVGDMYKRTGLNVLRYYLASKHSEADKETDTSVEIMPAQETSSLKNVGETLTAMCDDTDLLADIHVSYEPDTSENEIFFQFKSPSTSQDDMINFLPELTDTSSYSIPVYSNTLGDSVTDMSDQIVSCELLIHRGPMAFQETLSYFKDSSILRKTLNVVRKLPNGELEQGEDTGGVLRDLFSEFWTDFYSRCTVGRDFKVPSLRHDFGVEEWQAVARVLLYGWKHTGYLPIQISSVFMQQCLCRETVDSQDLLNNYFEFIAVQDKQVFQSGLDNYQGVDKEDLLDALDTHDCRTMVTEENLKSVILEMAHKELIQMPMYVSDCWRDIIVKEKVNLTLEKLKEVYDSLTVTNKKVVSMLEFPSTASASENDVVRNLKKYIREIDAFKLGRFLRYCTGSDIITVPKITIEFSPMSGLSRRPIAHTCGCVLVLSNKYENFMEFRSDFDGVLQDNTWVMDIV